MSIEITTWILGWTTRDHQVKSTCAGLVMITQLCVRGEDNTRPIMHSLPCRGTLYFKAGCRFSTSDVALYHNAGPGQV